MARFSQPIADDAKPGVVPTLTQGTAWDDAFMAALLIRMWSLASGRTLRCDVPPVDLSAEELIRFWADDLTEPTGRHVGAAGGLTGTAR
jgi:hypothetical protein